MGLRPLEIRLLSQCGDRLESSESDVYRRQILTTKVDPRAVRAKTQTFTEYYTGTVAELMFEFPINRCPAELFLLLVYIHLITRFPTLNDENIYIYENKSPETIIE